MFHKLYIQLLQIFVSKLTSEGTVERCENCIFSFSLHGGKKAKFGHHVLKEALRCANELNHLLGCEKNQRRDAKLMYCIFGQFEWYVQNCLMYVYCIDLFNKS